MAEPYLGEIRMFGGNFAPQGWALCQGQTMAISENTALFNLVGTTYGGDGVNTFGLPDLRGRVPIHQGSNGVSTYTVGQNGGDQTVTLTTTQIPGHSHPYPVSTDAGITSSPLGGVPAQSAIDQYSDAAPGATMASGVIGSTGGTQPHDNQLPAVAVNFIIALQGIFPTRS
jgi:microcystin-dependent protein